MRIGAAIAVGLVMIVAMACAGQRKPGFAGIEPTVCTRYVCVPAGSTAVPPTPDGTRPPDVTPSPVSSVTVTREPQPTAPATPGIVKTRDGRCYPVGGISEVPCP